MFPKYPEQPQVFSQSQIRDTRLGSQFPLTAQLRREQLSALLSQKTGSLRRRLRADCASLRTPGRPQLSERARQKMRRTKRCSSRLPHTLWGSYVNNAGLRYIKRVDGGEMDDLSLLRINRGFPHTFRGSGQCYTLFHKI